MRREGMERVKVSGILLCVLSLLVCLTTETAQAMKVMPGLQHVGTIRMDRSVMRGQDRLTAGPGGTLYVVDGLKNHVLKFDAKGYYLGDIHFPQVSAVGAAGDGTLYIGSHKDYSVAIYKDGKIIGHLGAGEKEFSSVRDIAVCRETGNIYVVDNIAHVVKGYTATGQRLGAIEGLNLPIGVTVVNGEIYVVDAPETADEMDRKGTGARISVYETSGSLKRSFSEAMTGSEGMFRPSGIAVDPNGVVYVSDILQNAVFAYDRTGKLVGSISGEIKGAAALAFSSEGILYLASGEKNEIQIFSLAEAVKKNESPEKEKLPLQEPPPIIVTISNPPSAGPDTEAFVEKAGSFVVTADSGSHNTVKVLGSDGKAVKEFVAFSAYTGGLDNAVGDINGDGVEEILVAQMDRGSLVGIFSSTGNPRYAFRAFDEGSGALVRTADIDGDGSSEIMVAKSGEAGARVFSYSGSEAVDTGIGLLTCGCNGAGSRIAAGDLDGDGHAELVTVTHAGEEQIIQTYKVTTRDGIGKWKAALQSERRLPQESSEITDVVVADIDGEGVHKIVLARNNGVITVISSDGSRADRQLSLRDITGLGQISEGKGAFVAGLSDGTVQILAADGTELRGFSSGITDAGVRVSSGRLTGGGREISSATSVVDVSTASVNVGSTWGQK